MQTSRITWTLADAFISKLKSPIFLLSLSIGALWLTTPLLAAQSNAAVSVKVDRGGEHGIRAELVDAGDYYLHSDGRRISLLRKRGIVAIESRGINSADLALKINTARPNINAQTVAQHELGQRLVLRLKGYDEPAQTSGAPSRANKTVPAIGQNSPQSLKTIDSRIARVSQVFSNAQGNGDLVLTSRATLKLVSQGDAQSLQTLAARHQFTIIRKLRTHGDMYSIAFVDETLSDSAVLAKVRAIAEAPAVLWAEPQFYSKPYKTSFTPSDTHFGNQWHLSNNGFRGSLCDADSDVDDAWALTVTNGSSATRGAGTVVAVIDDGVQLNHPDLLNNFWQNSGEACGPALSVSEFYCTDGIDNDGNGYIDDVAGWDFVDDTSSNDNLQNASLQGAGTCVGGVDSQAGPDNNPSPQAFTDCYTVNGDAVAQDDHGTAVAGLIAATGNNGLGVAGVAFEASILPLRVISDFDSADTASFCVAAAEATAYAGRYADVINNSWGMNDVCMALEDTIDDVVAGAVSADPGSTSEAVAFKRPTKGSPVIFASGNSASGWIKITVPISAGEHAYEWRFLRSAFPSLYDSSAEDNAVWLDEISFPDGSVEGFESGLAGYENDIVLNQQCDANCTSFVNAPRPVWEQENDSSRAFSGTSSARLNATGSDCGNSYLSVLREDPAGDLSFWVWVSSNLEDGSDKFEFLVDGQEVFSFGDISKFIDNDVAYPANLASTIAVGASWSGDLSGVSAPSATQERRVFYSQFGADLDVVAPSSGQHTGITTTDRTGASNGFNLGVNPADLLDTDYTNNFGGTSASAAIVAGAAAAIIAVGPSASADQVRTILHDSADKIGPLAYPAGRNDEYGFGRLNLYHALELANGDAMGISPSTDCSSPQAFDYLPASDSVIASLAPVAFCPAQGELPASDELCLPIKTKSNTIALICL